MAADKITTEKTRAGGINASRLINRSVVWDNHSCPPFSLQEHHVAELWRPRRAGFSFVSLNIGDAKMAMDQIITIADFYRSWIERHKDDFVFARSTSDILGAKRENKTAIAFDLEGAYALKGNVGQVETLWKLGVRWMSLVFNCSNWVGAGCHDEEDHGLTRLGRALIDEMDRVGMVKCCSHTGYRTSMEVLTRSDRPTVFSHSNTCSVHPHPRNIPDELIIACAETDGVVGVNGLSIFLGNDNRLVSQMGNHIDHIVQLVGPRHVGLGLDFVYDQASLSERINRSDSTWPKGHGYGSHIKYINPEQLGEIVDMLLDRGYAESDIEGILGGNFLRVAENAWNQA